MNNFLIINIHRQRQTRALYVRAILICLETTNRDSTGFILTQTHTQKRRRVFPPSLD